MNNKQLLLQIFKDTIQNKNQTKTNQNTFHVNLVSP